jgi:phage/plasmid-associated DNA primase
MHTNFLPSLKSLDNGTRRRIAVAPFTMALKPDEVIKDFGNKLLREEGPAILRWMIEGAVKFYKAGMAIKLPAVIRHATDAYLDAEDWFSAFIEDCCTLDPNATVASSLLYARYVEYAKSNGEYSRTNKVFAAELDKRGFERRRMNTGVKVRGLKLAESDIV